MRYRTCICKRTRYCTIAVQGSMQNTGQWDVMSKMGRPTENFRHGVNKYAIRYDGILYGINRLSESGHSYYFI